MREFQLVICLPPVIKYWLNFRSVQILAVSRVIFFNADRCQGRDHVCQQSVCLRFVAESRMLYKTRNHKLVSGWRILETNSGHVFDNFRLVKLSRIVKNIRMPCLPSTLLGLCSNVIDALMSSVRCLFNVISINCYYIRISFFKFFVSF